MKAIYAAIPRPGAPSGEPSIIERVYDEQTRQALGEALEFVAPLTSLEELEPRREELGSVEVLFSTWGSPPLTEEQLASCFPRLKAVFYAAGSVQYFARPFLARGVRIFSAADANAIPVAEYTAAQVVLANKGFYRTSRLYKEGAFPQAKEEIGKYPGNYDGLVGIIGAGKIGSLTIRMLKEYRLDLLVFDPFLPPERARELGVELCGLEELFSRCQVVSNHLADNEKTRGMLDYSLFSRMGSHSTFLNTARGAQVVEADLVRALEEDPTRTAVLDVTFPEPVEEGHPFLSLPNVVLTPHIAGSSGNEIRRMGRFMADEFFAFRDGKPLRYEVTTEMLETMA